MDVLLIANDFRAEPFKLTLTLMIFSWGSQLGGFAEAPMI
jgi:hypothetical protein